MAAGRWTSHDNCVHTLHNALAAAGVWKPKSVRTTKLRQFFNLAVPANTFVELAFLSNEYPIENFSRIRADPLRWKGLVENNWLPAVPGALVRTMPVHQVNLLYDTMLRLFVLKGLLRDDTTKRVQRLMSDGRYLQIDANLRYFYDRYTAILMERERDGGFLSYLRGEGDSEARETYHVYMQEAMNRLRVALTRLAELDAQRQQRRAR